MRVYSYDRQLIESGAESYQIATHGWWFTKLPDGSYDTSHVDVPTIDRHIAAFGNEPGPLLVDIECWNFETEHELIARELPIAVGRWRAASQRQLGFYAHIPERSWFIPIKWLTAVRANDTGPDRTEMWAWRDRNIRNAADFLPLFDFICPSLYVFYRDQWEAWRVYAEANIDEAARICAGKPVRPIIYPRYPDLQLIEIDNWSVLVHWVATHTRVESIMIYNLSEPPWRDPLIQLIQGNP